MKSTFTIRRAPARLLLLVGALALVAGCESIGKGNKLEKIEIVPFSGRVNADGSYRVYQCFRDGLSLRGTFTDGTVGFFTSRATWTSSDSGVVRVTNADEPLIAVFKPNDRKFGFNPMNGAFYSRGTLIPVAASDDVVTITAEFAGLKDEIKVRVRTPGIKISPSPISALTGRDPGTEFVLGVGSRQDFTVLADLDGEIVEAAAAGSFDPVFNSVMNPVQWSFVGGTATDPKLVILEDGADNKQGTEDDIDAYRAFSADDGNDSDDDDSAMLDPLSGLVTAQSAGGAITLRASLSACDAEIVADAEALAIPDVTVQVAGFADADPLTIAREAGFENRPLVIGTNEVIPVTGKLDVGGKTQDLGSQVRFDVNDKTQCGDTKAGEVCVNPTFRFDISPPNALETAPGAQDGGAASIDACFPIYRPVATLSADGAGSAISATAPLTVTLDASGSLHPDPSVELATYAFDFGDGEDGVMQKTPTVSHTYSKTGTFTATVRVTDACGQQSINTGAVQIVVGSTPTNAVPLAALSVVQNAPPAPLTATLEAVDSSAPDSDSGDKIAVYEFRPGDDTVIRQKESTLRYVYRTAGAYSPSLKVFDSRGIGSGDPAADPDTAAVTVAGAIVPTPRSNSLSVWAKTGTLESITLCPRSNLNADLTCAKRSVTEAAFTFPGAQFEAIGSFDIGLQKVTRYVTWYAQPRDEADGEEPCDTEDDGSDIAGLSNAFLTRGLLSYFRNVAEPVAPLEGETLDICALPGAPFDSADTPSPATLVVAPCDPDAAGVCPEVPPDDEN